MITKSDMVNPRSSDYEHWKQPTAQLPAIPPTISLYKRTAYTKILNAIGPKGNYRFGIDSKLPEVSTYTTGQYLQQLKHLGLIERVTIPSDEYHGNIQKWVWKE